MLPNEFLLASARTVLCKQLLVFRWGREGIDFLQLGMLELCVRSGLLDSGNRALPALPQELHHGGLANTPTISGAGVS